MQPNKIVYRWLAHSHIHIESQSFIVYGLCNFTKRLVHVCVRSCEVIVCCTQLLCVDDVRFVALWMEMAIEKCEKRNSKK